MTAVKRDLEWQGLWFTLRAHRWTSLVVLGIDAATGAGEVARRLAAVGNLDKKTPVRVISALGMSIEEAGGVVSYLQEPETWGEMALTVVACDAPGVNPAMIPIVQAASAAVVVVRLRESLLDSVKATVENIGRDKVLATVSVG